MKMKEWTIALACLLVLMIGNNSYAQTAGAVAGANQGQSQGQQQVGGVGVGVGTAEQGQSQSQGNGGSGGAGGSTVNSGNATFSNSFNGSAPIRYLPVPTAVPMENYQPAVLGNVDYTDKGPTFISMRQLVAAMNLVDLSVEIEGERQIRILTQMMAAMKTPKKSKDSKENKFAKEKPEDKVVFEINDGKAVNHGFTPIATLSVETKVPDKSNSASLAIAIGKAAKALGAKRVIFLTEGSSKLLKSSGWGVGLSYNYATVGSKASDSGSVGSGGTGYSQGKAGYRNLIYITAIVGN